MPRVRRKLLGACLRRFREQAGSTIDDAARVLTCEPPRHATLRRNSANHDDLAVALGRTVPGNESDAETYDRSIMKKNSDRKNWNHRYSDGFRASFEPHPLAVQALAMHLPEGLPVLDLACGPSGSVLLAAAAGRPVVAVDVSDVALDVLGAEARRRGIDGLISLVNADLGTWRPSPGEFGLVLCTRYWGGSETFASAVAAVAPGGLLGWEAFTLDALRARPDMPAQWCLKPGEPASLLPADFEVLGQHDLTDGADIHGAARRMLARRQELAS